MAEVVTEEDVKTYCGTGRRKSSVARVRIRRGEGQFVVNGRDMEDYFVRERDRDYVRAPLKVTRTLNKYDVLVRVNGGGITGQAGAVVLGIARALRMAESETEHVLREGGYLTRDARMVERKKYGRRKARGSFQFSKR